MQPPSSATARKNGNRRVTAATVAARAGVSAATVSLVTNGKTAGRVSEENIAKVEQAVRELGYVVDGLGSSLAKGHSNIVILVAPDVSNPFYAKVIAGLREVIGQKYALLLSVTDAGQTPNSEDVRRLLALRPAGLLIDAPSARFLAELQATEPMVLLDTAGISEDLPSVNFDVASGARLLAQHLAGQGHRNVAYLDSSTATETFRLRRAAFCAEAAALGCDVVAETQTTIDVGAAALTFAQAWPQWSAAGVTAIVCATDTQAYGVLQEARVVGLPVPQSLAVTGFDDLPYSQTSSPGLTTVHLPAMEMGRLAGKALLQVIGGENVVATPVVLEATLVVRGSTVATI
ncbi:LacI family transcriptional regulator [Arthrobacter alpinus]|uniref:LacI family transcriptional regulator n=1 Tax=Arthrobacter alpinus TaxID=656366 RepID=A0A0S2LWJ2_9MICC|nr:LacI family DNA-binding transcriptional regulator [Arthrobacter alpinus]ALO65681.1 LacI family transcriptional regulator [Arthrobacter alpinus]